MPKIGHRVPPSPKPIMCKGKAKDGKGPCPKQAVKGKQYCGEHLLKAQMQAAKAQDEGLKKAASEK